MAGEVRSNARDPLAGRIPIILITGFLGSGKTTLLGRLLRHPGMARAAVIINELGDIAIDHQLVAASSEQMTLLGNGCLCCTVRTDLQETLRELFIKRRSGEVIDFDRVFVETTGLADPVPVLVNLGPSSAKTLPPELNRWLGTGDSDSYLGKRLAGAHDAGIRAFSLRFEQPFTWDGLNAALQTLTALRGPDLLRVKGIVNVEGETGPVILQAAQHVIHPPVTLESWRDADRSTRIVFIVRNIMRESVEALFAAVGALAER